MLEKAAEIMRALTNADRKEGSSRSAAVSEKGGEL
jgi:hypothetical protein